MPIHSAKNSIIGTTRPLPSSKCSVVYVIISESPETRLVPISIRAISMHKTESGKFQTGNTFPKQYWLAVNGKPKTTTYNQTTAPTWAGPVETVVGWTLSQNLPKPTLLVVVRHKTQAETGTCRGELTKNLYIIICNLVVKWHIWQLSSIKYKDL